MSKAQIAQAIATKFGIESGFVLVDLNDDRSIQCASRSDAAIREDVDQARQMFALVKPENGDTRELFHVQSGKFYTFNKIGVLVERVEEIEVPENAQMNAYRNHKRGNYEMGMIYTRDAATLNEVANQIEAITIKKAELEARAEANRNRRNFADYLTDWIKDEQEKRAENGEDSELDDDFILEALDAYESVFDASIEIIINEEGAE
jgi:hypothetical protein